MRISGFVLATLTVAVVLPAPALAQTTFGAIRGTVRDEQAAALPGVTVTARAIDAQAHAAASDEHGVYRLQNLPPGIYQVTAELQGFSKLVQDHVEVRAGVTLAVDLTLKVGQITETLDVSGDAPLLEAQTGTFGVNITGDLKRAIPLTANRDWLDFLNMVPGVVGTATAFRVHGTEFDAHVLMIDGADVASAASNSNTLVQLSQEAMEDAQVKTGGMDASSPLGYGAVVNVVTQSGTNAYKGAGGFVYGAKRFNGNNNPGGTSAKNTRFQPDFGVGGPILRDRLWFFGTYRYEKANIGLARSATQLTQLKAIYPQFEPFDNVTEAHNYFAKGTLRWSANHTFETFYQYDKTPVDQNQAISTRPMSHNDIGGWAYNFRLSSIWTRNLTTRLGVSGNRKDMSMILENDAPARPVNTNVVVSGNVLIGSGAIAYLDNQFLNSTIQNNRKLTITADATYAKRGWIGSHEFQAGLFVQPNLRTDTTVSYPNDGFVQEQMVLVSAANPSAGIRPFARQYVDRLELPQTRIESSDVALYVQDVWRPTDRITLSYGLRVDRVRHRDAVFDVQMQDSVNVGPRFGLNYAVTADRKNVIHATLVRVHDAPSGNAAPSVTGNNRAGIRSLFDVNADGVFETEANSPALTALSIQRSISPDYEQPHIDEVTVGYSRQLPGLITIDATFLHRLYKDRPTYVEYNAIYDGGVFRGYRDESQNMLYRGENNIWNWPVYSDFELTASKRTANLQIMGSWTRQWRHLSGTWQPNDPAAIIQPGTFANDKNIGYVRPSAQTTSEANSYTAATIPGGAQWTDHAIRVAASYHLPWDFVIATSYIRQIGRWSGVIIKMVTPDPAFGPPSLILSNGRTVTNPLATATRFAFDDRGEGQFTAPPWVVWNVRGGRDFGIGPHVLQFAVDVYNVTNRAKDTGFLTTSTNFSNAAFGTTAGRQAPRSGTISLRYVF